MFKRIDRSERISQFIEWLSTILSRQRGLPAVIGITIFIMGFVVQVINVFMDSTFLELLGVIATNGGVLVALIGLLLSDPLGQ